LPDISKFSGTLIDGVSKVDGVLKDSISTIDGITLPPLLPYTPPLDVFSNAVLAYSVRKIRTDYAGPCLEAYRSSDGATLDIGFDANGLLSEAELAAFYDGNPILVSRWYDQSTSANDMVQATPADMPTVYQDFSASWAAGGVTVGRLRPAALSSLDPLNSSFTITATGAVHTKRMDVVTPITSVGPTYSALAISNGNSNSSHIYGNTGGQTLITTINSTRWNLQGTGGGNFAIADNLNGQNSLLVRRSSSADLNFNGLTPPSGTITGGSGTLGDFHLWDSQFITQYNGNISEFILFSDDKWSNMGAIVNNSGSYFNTSLVVNPDAATSGFLFDYPGAAVAYSVRQLNNNATASMRVRRTVAPFDEQDIGFDSNGELDTSAISTFGGSDPLTVSVWYDQTGGCNHSSQTIEIRQPEIYDGVSVNLDNGKPAVRFTDPGQDSNRDTLDWGYDVDTQLFSWSCVAGFSPSGAVRTIIHRDNTGAGNYLRVDTNGYVIVKPNDFDGLSGSTFDGTQKLNTVIRSSATTATSYQDGSQTGTISTLDASNIVWGNTDANITGTGVLSFNVQEIVLWTSDESTNRTGIETNINGYYSIY
jgi:hypothetical protein